MSALTTSWAANEMRARGYRVLEGAPREITGGSADSRTTRTGELFTAYRGENVDGNDYVGGAVARDAAAIVCERFDGDAPAHCTIVIAPDARKAVGELAHAWRMHCNPRVVGVTGTVGKTTAKDLIAATLSSKFRTHKSEGNFNSLEGLPLALMNLTTEHEVSVLEMGMDRAGEIVELCEIARPDVGVVLNVGLTHVEKLGSIEAIALEKLSLARWLPATGTAVLNIDDPRIAPASGSIAANEYSFSAKGGAGRLRYSAPELDGLNGSTFEVCFESATARVHSPLPGLHTVPAAMAAISCAVALGLTLAEAADAVSATGVTGRVRQLPGGNGSTILDDRYNSSPASLMGALRMLGALPGRHLAIVGKMAELGDFEEQAHRDAGAVAALATDILAAVGEPCRALIETARSEGHANARWFEDKNEAATWLANQLQPGDHVLVKASRSQAFETIIPILEGAQ